MDWFRSSRCGLTWLAYFALACQLFLSFGHVHLGSAGSTVPAKPAATDSVNATANGPGAPANNNSERALEGFCAICANVSLAAALLIPAAPAILSPRSFARKLEWSRSADDHAPSREFPFDARGPPHA